MNLINISQLELPDNFRETLMKRLFQVIRSSESGMLVGPAGMGKTLTLELLENKSIQEHYLPKSEIVCIHLNLQSTSPDDILSHFKTLSLSATSKLLIVADNAEALEGSKGKDLIQRLKEAREHFRAQSSVLMAGERNILGSESFSESSSLRSILMENLVFVTPLNENESKFFAEAIAKQLNFSISEKLSRQIVSAGGGAPRIIKRLVKLAEADGKHLQEVLKNPTLDQKLTFDLESLAIFAQSNSNFSFASPLLTLLKPQNVTKDKIGPVQFSVTLTKQEFTLAKTLVESKGELVGREEMIKAIWPTNLYETSEHALDQMIHRLKKKLESATPTCTLITYRGRGAKLSI